MCVNGLLVSGTFGPRIGTDEMAGGYALFSLRMRREWLKLQPVVLPHQEAPAQLPSCRSMRLVGVHRHLLYTQHIPTSETHRPLKPRYI